MFRKQKSQVEGFPKPEIFSKRNFLEFLCKIGLHGMYWQEGLEGYCCECVKNFLWKEDIRWEQQSQRT